MLLNKQLSGVGSRLSKGFQVGEEEEGPCSGVHFCDQSHIICCVHYKVPVSFLKFFLEKVHFSCDLAGVCFEIEGHFKRHLATEMLRRIPEEYSIRSSSGRGGLIALFFTCKPTQRVDKHVFLHIDIYCYKGLGANINT